MSFAQVVVTGQVLDAENNAPIVGASVTTGQGSTLRGVTTDLNGKFRIDVPHRAKITIRSIGYNQIILDKVGTGAKTVELGKILLTPDAVSLGQVEVIASVVPKDRKVPVPVSIFPSNKLNPRPLTQSSRSFLSPLLLCTLLVPEVVLGILVS